MGRGSGGEASHVVLAEVLAARWQLVVLEVGQQLAQLQEEALAGLVAVGVHVGDNGQLTMDN